MIKDPGDPASSINAETVTTRDGRSGTLVRGRYAVVRSLGPGAVSAEDTVDGQRPVVVRFLSCPDVGEAECARIEHEAGLLGAPSGAALPEAIAIGRALLGGLRDLHARGIVHRGVRPSNVILGLDEAGRIRDVTLVDACIGAPGATDAAARYLAPEATGLLEQPVDARTDLHGAGIVLFETLARRPAFEAPVPGAEPLRLHLARPPELRSLGVAVPRAVDEWVARLVRIDPRDRYHSAAGALADLESIAAGLARGEAEPRVVIGLGERRSTLAEPAFVGRFEEVAALDRELDKAFRGEGGLALVEAQSGGGKSRLLDELASRAAGRGAWVLRGQALDQERGWPSAAADLAEGGRALREMEARPDRMS